MTGSRAGSHDDPVDGASDLTVKILQEIRDEIRTTNSKVDALRQDTGRNLGDLRNDMNQRLDFLAEGQVRMRTEMTGVRGELADLRSVVERNGERFEHFLATNGDIVRDLKGRVARVEAHLGLDS